MAKRKSDRRDGRPGGSPASAPSHLPSPARLPGLWLYGSHPVMAALGNPRRLCRRLLITAESERTLGAELARLLAARPSLSRETVTRNDIDRILPGTVNQGLALEVEPLEDPELDEVLRRASGMERAVLVILDQVTDPHNVGAILRSAAAFGALAVVVTERHAPATTAALAKAASGALEAVPLVRVTNLARSLDEIKAAGVWCIGLDALAPVTLSTARLDGRVALVLGAEGQGLRRLTRERCDLLVRVPMAASAVASLNVSNAAAVALYEVFRNTPEKAE